MLLQSKMNIDGYPWAPTHAAVGEFCGNVPGMLQNLQRLLSHMLRLVRALEANILIPEQSGPPAWIQVSFLYCRSSTEYRAGQLNPWRREVELQVLRQGSLLSWDSSL